MKVMVISKFFAPMTRARAVQVTKAVDALHAAGCNIRVVAGEDTPIGERLEHPYPVEYVPIPKMTDMWKTVPFHKRLRGRARNMHVRRAWIHEAYKACTRSLSDSHPDVYMTVSEPYDSHIVGLRLRRQCRMPWIAYFSDPSPFAAMPPPYDRQKSAFMNWAEMHAVRRPLMHCDALVMTNPYAVRRMECAFRCSLSGKSSCIPHVGTKLPGSRDCTNMRLTHIGDLYNRFSPPLLEAVRRAAEDMPDRFPGVLFVGRITDEARHMIAKSNMGNLIEIRDTISHIDAQELAATSKALLVIEARMPESPFLPSKFADYAMAGRPIIAITPPVSPIRDYLSRHGGGIAVRDDIEEILGAIRSVYSGDYSHEDSESGPGSGGLSGEFDAAAVAGKYMELFNSLCKSGADSGSS